MGRQLLLVLGVVPNSLYRCFVNLKYIIDKHTVHRPESFWTNQYCTKSYIKLTVYSHHTVITLLKETDTTSDTIIISFCKYLCISAPWTCCRNVLQCWCSFSHTVDTPQQCHSMHTMIHTWIATFHAYLNVCISCVSKQHFILQILIRLKWEFCLNTKTAFHTTDFNMSQMGILPLKASGQSAFHGYLNVCIPSIPKCQHNILYFHSTDVIVSDGIFFLWEGFRLLSVFHAHLNVCIPNIPEHKHMIL